MGSSLFSNFDFNVTNKKSKNTDKTKENVFYTFPFGNPLNIFKCGVFHHSVDDFMSCNLLLNGSLFSVTYINSPMLALT